LSVIVASSGAVTYFVPKNNTVVDISYSAISGDITTDITSVLYSYSNPNLTSILANNVRTLGATSCLLLTSIIMPRAIYCAASNSSLTAKAIGEILYAAYLEDRQNVNFTFNGGNNANSTSIDSYLQVTYGVTLAVVVTRLDVTGTITLKA
jgi:hypothetical protein